MTWFQVLTTIAAWLGTALGIGALWLNRRNLHISQRAAERQKRIDNPRFAFSREPGRNCISIRNCGGSDACDVRARTEKKSRVKWAGQVNTAAVYTDASGHVVGGEEPWTTDCAGETRNIPAGESLMVVLGEGYSRFDALVVSCENYMGETITQRKAFKEIFPSA